MFLKKSSPEATATSGMSPSEINRGQEFLSAI
jgi:hypothetical protein